MRAGMGGWDANVLACMLVRWWVASNGEMGGVGACAGCRRGGAGMDTAMRGHARVRPCLGWRMSTGAGVDISANTPRRAHAGEHVFVWGLCVQHVHHEASACAFAS